MHEFREGHDDASDVDEASRDDCGSEVAFSTCYELQRGRRRYAGRSVPEVTVRATVVPVIRRAVRRGNSDGRPVADEAAPRGTRI